MNIDPEKPALPIGYPAAFPVYLTNRHGPFATLGLAEDTWGLNEHILADEHFLRQCHGHRMRARGDVLGQPRQGAERSVRMRF